PRALDAMIMRFDRLSLRERLLIFGALLAGVITAWQGTLMEPLAQREKTLSVELTGLQESLARVSRATESVASSDPTTQALQRLADRKKALEAINAKLAAESAGLIPPSQMVQVIHDVLKNQQGLTLVSLKNLPVANLVADPKRPENASPAQPDANTTAH